MDLRKPMLAGCGCCPPLGLSRRNLLGAAAGAAASALVCDTPAMAAAPAKGKGIIDVHHHLVPPFYLQENRERIAASRGGSISPEWLSWSPEIAIETMDQHGIETGILSYSSPGIWFGKADESRTMARRCNEYAIELEQKHKGRFGLFATIPLPDTEGSLKEIEYALDTLKADGIGIFTSYPEGWLGDPKFDPVFQELNRRKAVVFVHPTTPNCCRTLLKDVPPLVNEVTVDTSRTITNLLFTGALNRFRDIKFIFCHGGGTIPMVWGRMQGQAPADIAQKVPEGIENALKRLHYDIAGTTYKPAIAALKTLVPTSQILFGSDNPFVPLKETAGGYPNVGFTKREMKAISRDNAIRLLPRLAT